MEGQRDRDRDTAWQTGGGKEIKAQNHKAVTKIEEMQGGGAIRTEGNRGGQRRRERDRSKSRHSSHISPPNRSEERQEGERQSNHACLSPPNRGCRGRDGEEAGSPLPSEVSLSLPVSLCLPDLRSIETSWEHSEVSVSL